MKQSHTWKDIHGKKHKVYKKLYYVYDANGSKLGKYAQENAAREYLDWYNSHIDVPGFETPAIIKDFSKA